MTLREQFIAIVDNDCVQESDAIILLEGDGFNRYPKAVELYKSGIAKEIIFSGGIIDYNYGSIPFDEIFPLLLQQGIPEEHILHENISQNTKEQAVEVIQMALSNNWQKLVLVASHYHQYRAYLTFLKEILTTGGNIQLFNAPASELRWFEQTHWGKRIDLLSSEFKRINLYTQKGDLATYREAIEYQQWKEQQ